MGQDKVHERNHDEADSRIILLAFKETNDAAVNAKDTNVLVLLIISNTIGSSNMLSKNMLTYAKSVTTWVKMPMNQ